MARDPQPIVVSGAGAACEILGSRFAVLLAGEQTGSSFAVIECRLPAGTAVPPHFHLHEDVLLLVKQGRLLISHEGRPTLLAADGVFFAPRGSVHALQSPAEGECTFWLLTAPAGLESICTQLAQEQAGGAAPTADRLAALFRGYGLHRVPAEAGPGSA